MKDNMLVGFSFILCGEFHGISMGAYVKKVSTKSPFELTVRCTMKLFLNIAYNKNGNLHQHSLLQYQTHPFLF